MPGGFYEYRTQEVPYPDGVTKAWLTLPIWMKVTRTQKGWFVFKHNTVVAQLTPATTAHEVQKICDLIKAP